MIRYADDNVFCFQYEEEARAFYQALINRLKKFNLELAEDKTKIIAFGRNAEVECKRQGERKPDTFDFLGFTHYCSKSQKGWFRVKRKTSRKKYKASLLRFKEWTRKNRNMPIKELMDGVKSKIRGHIQYYSITDNAHKLYGFISEVQKMLFKWLNRRSQKRSFNWDKFNKFLKRHPLPQLKIHVNIYELRPEIGYIL
jgi:hypothetical protein